MLVRTFFKVLETREDGTIIVKRPNGTRIVEHSDGTRITTFLREMPRKTEHETGEEEVAVEAEIESIKVGSKKFYPHAKNQGGFDSVSQLDHPPLYSSFTAPKEISAYELLVAMHC